MFLFVTIVVIVLGAGVERERVVPLRDGGVVVGVVQVVGVGAVAAHEGALEHSPKHRASLCQDPTVSWNALHIWFFSYQKNNVAIFLAITCRDRPEK